MVQVKYEMLRRHRVDGCSVTEVAAEFGVSRQTFYKLERAFEARGILGLLPSKSGPRGGWKCTPELLDFLKQRRSERPGLEIADLRDEVERRFQVKLHPNTVRYALAKAG
jgi:transposase